MKIILNGLNAGNMGEATDVDAAGYRTYLAAKFSAEFPDAKIEVNEADSTHSIVVVLGEYDCLGLDLEQRFEILDQTVEMAEQFARQCWENCPWDWVS